MVENGDSQLTAADYKGKHKKKFRNLVLLKFLSQNEVV